jgi:hypothetical protein
LLNQIKSFFFQWNKGIIFYIPLFFLSCQSPYKYLINDFKLNTKEGITYSDYFLYIENQNSCFQYQIIINPPLIPPFLPSLDYGWDFERNSPIIANHFLWVRVYLKTNIRIDIDIQKYTIKQNNTIFYPIKVSELLLNFPYYLNNVPIFWFSIPKEPYFYLKEVPKWLKEFYFNPPLLEARANKIQFFKNYFENYTRLEVEKDKELLFYLTFFPLRSSKDLYTFEFQNTNNECNFNFSFNFEQLLKDEPLNYFEDKKFQIEILKKLRKQNEEWNTILQTKLKEHEYNEFISDFWKK